MSTDDIDKLIAELNGDGVPGDDDPIESVVEHGNAELSDSPSADDPPEVWMNRTPSTTVRFPVPWKFESEGTVYTIRFATIRATDGVDEDLLVARVADAGERASRTTLMLSRNIVALYGEEGDPRLTRPANAALEGEDPRPAPAFFVPALEAMPLLNKPALIVAVRRLSAHLPEAGMSGHAFKFRTACPACDAERDCLVRLDLMETRYASDEVAFESNRVFSAAGYRVGWVLPTVSKEGKIAAIVASLSARKEGGVARNVTYKDKVATALLAVTVTSINGNRLKNLRQLTEVPSSVRSALRDAMDVGGLNVLADVECLKCGKIHERVLPTSEPSFFFPSAR